MTQVVVHPLPNEREGPEHSHVAAALVNMDRGSLLLSLPLYGCCVIHAFSGCARICMSRHVGRAVELVVAVDLDASES